MLQLDSASVSEDLADLCDSRAADALAEGVLRHPSILARLIHVAALRNDHGDLEDLLARMHLKIFVRWLEMPLRQKRCDAAICCGSSSPDTGMLHKLLATAEASIPPAAIQPERELFLQEIELVVALLANRD